ncbi:HAD family hydrolase [Candidatus Saccharibacteria bacterium]|nr:HAD family hydrolase [Candidatus Saccharibacteria bacterium]
MSKIEMVIFDAGGVLHENNSAVSEDLMKELSIGKGVISQIWTEEIPLLGSGKIGESEFWQLVSEKHGLRKVDPVENLLGRAFAEQLTPIKGIGDILGGLAELGVRTAVLSNTIEPHARALREAGLYDSFYEVLLSYEIGLRKPNPGIYRYALETLKTKLETTIFIDDDPKNTRIATQMGIRGITFTSPNQLESDLRRHIPNL